MATNLRSLYLVTREVLPGMLDRRVRHHRQRRQSGGQERHRGRDSLRRVQACGARVQQEPHAGGPQARRSGAGHLSRVGGYRADPGISATRAPGPARSSSPRTWRRRFSMRSGCRRAPWSAKSTSGPPIHDPIPNLDSPSSRPAVQIDRRCLSPIADLPAGASPGIRTGRVDAGDRLRQPVRALPPLSAADARRPGKPCSTRSSSRTPSEQPPARRPAPPTFRPRRDHRVRAAGWAGWRSISPIRIMARPHPGPAHHRRADSSRSGGAMSWPGSAGPGWRAPFPPPRPGTASSSCSAGSAPSCSGCGAAASCWRRWSSSPTGLLEAEGAAILLVVEEGRFLKVAAGAGLLRAGGGKPGAGGAIAGRVGGAQRSAGHQRRHGSRSPELSRWTPCRPTWSARCASRSGPPGW